MGPPVPKNPIARQRLLARIHRRYATTTQRVRIGALEFFFSRITDPDRVLDEVAAEADRQERLTGRRESDERLHLPYWAELWDSAAGVGQFLERHAPPAPKASVLDLGCGMGLAGCVAAALDARVLFADLEPPALLFAQLNSLPWAMRCRTRRLNWQTDRLDRQFNLILGSDILYERSQWDYLDRFWRAHLAPGGSILLGEPGRQTGDLFIDWILTHGWTLELFCENVPTRKTPVRIFRLTPPFPSDDRKSPA